MSQRFSDILRHPAVLPAVASVTAGAVGFGVGYFIGRKRGSVNVTYFEPDETGNDHPFDAHDISEMLSDVPTVDEEVQKSTVDHILEAEQYSANRDIVSNVKNDPKDIVVEEPVVYNIFDRPEDEDWDWETELESRTGEAPYVIHREEYFRDEMGCSQTTLTYYAGDNILVDERDVPIHQHEKITGDLKFGHGTGDPHVVYIRNEELQAEYEVLLEEGFYQVEVLGISIENDYEEKDLKHSRHFMHKMRED